MSDATVLTRVPPHSLEAERAVLSAILLDSDILPRVRQKLSFDDFYRSVHGLAFQHAVRIYDEKKAVDPVLLAEALRHDDRAKDLLGGDPLAFFKDLVDAAPSPANGPYYAEIVAGYAYKRKIIALTANLQAGGYNGEAGKELKDRALQEFKFLGEMYEPRDELAWRFTTIGELLKNPPEDKNHHVWPDVIARGAVTLFAGAPKAGKSTIIDALAYALENKQPWLNFDAKDEEIRTVIVSEEAPAQLNRRFRRVGFGEEAKVVVLPRGGKPTNAKWVETVEMAAKEAVKHGATVVVFDTLRGLAGFHEGRENEAGAVQQTIGPLLDIAARHNLAVVPTHHARKSQAGFVSTAIDSVAGSNALTGAVDQVVTVSFTDGEEGPRRTLSFRGRLDPQPALVVELTKDPIWRFSVQGTAQDVKSEVIDQKIVEVVTRENRWLQKSEIEALVGGRAATVRSRVETLYFKTPPLLARTKPSGSRYYLFGPVGMDPSKAVAKEVQTDE